MACPQCENGFTRIANELLEAIIRADLSKRQLKILLAVIRQTYGWDRKADVISASKLATLTGLDARHCRRTVAELVELGMVTNAPTETGKLLSVVKDYDLWGGTIQAGAGQNSPQGWAKTAQGGWAKMAREGGPKRPTTIERKKIQTLLQKAALPRRVVVVVMSWYFREG